MSFGYLKSSAMDLSMETVIDNATTGSFELLAGFTDEFTAQRVRPVFPTEGAPVIHFDPSFMLAPELHQTQLLAPTLTTDAPHLEKAAEDLHTVPNATDDSEGFHQHEGGSGDLNVVASATLAAFGNMATEKAPLLAAVGAVATAGFQDDVAMADEEEAAPHAVLALIPATVSIDHKVLREYYIGADGLPCVYPVPKSVGQTPRPKQLELVQAMLSVAGQGVSFPTFFASIPDLASKFIGTKFVEAEKKIRQWVKLYNAANPNDVRKLHFKHSQQEGSFLLSFPRV